MKWLRWGLALALGGTFVGCAGARGGAPRAPGTETARNAERFAQDERQLFDALAAIDARLALRTGTVARDADVHKNVVGAILAEDANTTVSDEGALDVFSFEARQRGLDEAARRIGRWTYPLEPRVDLDRQLLGRLVEEERARVTEERSLPRSASELVRGIVKAWVPPRDEEALRGRDAWMTRRLGDVLASLKDGALTKFEANELDDSLDALERLTAGFPQTGGALARLRLALDQIQPAHDPVRDGDRVRRVAHAHLGLSIDRTTFETMEQSERTLREAIAQRTAGRDEAETRAIEERALANVFSAGRCAGSGSRVRGIEPPPERVYVCGMLRTLAGAEADRERTAALIALHTHLVVALWTSPIHFGDDAPYRAANKLRPVMPMPPEREVQLLQVAAVRPVAALATGWATVLLTRPGLHAARDRANAWLAFGDAPLDVVESAHALDAKPAPHAPVKAKVAARDAR